MEFWREGRSLYVTTYVQLILDYNVSIGIIDLVRNQCDNGRYELLLISKDCNPLYDDQSDGVCLHSNMSRDEWREFIMQWMIFSDERKIKFASEALWNTHSY